MNNITFRTFSSDDKTDTSYQKPLKYKLINDMKKLKNLSFLKQLERINSFHHNSLKNSLNTNYNYFKFGKEKLKTSDSTIIIIILQLKIVLYQLVQLVLFIIIQLEIIY